MTSPRSQPPTARRHTAWFVWLGVALLAVSVLGAGKSLQSPGDAPPVSSKSSDLHAGGFGHVDLEEGVTNMYPLQSGRVVAVLARDGEEVKKDAPLFRLDDTLAQIDFERAGRAVRESELQLETARAGVERHKAALKAQQKGVEAKRANVRVAEAQAAEAKRLNDAGQLGNEKRQQADEAVKALTAEADAEEQKELAIRALDPTIAVRRAENDLAEKKLLVRKAQFGLDECTVKAPANGKVLRMLVAVGDPLGPTPRQPAVQFAIEGPFIVRAEIDQEFASRVERGQVAEIQDDVRTGPTWSGKVRRVSDWYTHRRSILQEPLQFNDVRTLEVIIQLDNPPADLKIGQRVRVTLR